MTRRLWLLLLPLVAFLVLVVLFWSRLGENPTVVPSARLEHALPTFALPDLHQPNQMVTPQSLKGQVYLLNVWGTWCPTCWIEHPYLLKLAQQGVVIVGMNYKDYPEAARKFLADKGNPYRQVIVDEAGGLGLDLGVTGAPETFLIDAEGRIRHHIISELNEAVWQRELAPRYDALRQGKPLPAEVSP